MEKINFSNLEKVLIIGAGGKTGYWYIRLLLKHGREVYAYDQNPLVKFDAELLENPKFHRISDEKFNDFSILDSVDSLSLSPGVSLRHPVILRAVELGKFVFSELEYCFPLLADRKWVCVTGTDGKSTTVSLIEHLMCSLDVPAIACGNIGLSFSRLLVEEEGYKKFGILVAELSSYQLELCRNLRADVGLYLNLAPDHLDRYPDIEAYGMAKWNVAFAVGKNGRFIVNKNLMPGNSIKWKDSEKILNALAEIETLEVDTQGLSSRNFFFENEKLFSRKNSKCILEAKDLGIRGNHNFGNLLFALEAMDYFKINDVRKICAAALSFKSLPHRYEKIASESGNVYINDSKATTTQAARIAVENSPSPLFVFLGGKSKGESYCDLADVIIRKKAFPFIFGQNREEIAGEFLKKNYPVSGKAENLEEIMDIASGFQKENNFEKATYLLSPASTSWDQYSSFEERGEHFRKIVEKLGKKNKM